MIKSINFDQQEIIRDIISLHNNGLPFDVDPTYSKGVFYKNGAVPQPVRKFDLFPQTEDTVMANANCLPLGDGSVRSIMFDPPFIAGHTKKSPTGIIGERFHGFRYVKDLWEWYAECLVEFHRILSKNGVLVFKCQDTVSSGRQHLSHVRVIQDAERIGFYCKDVFILLAKSRIVGHNHSVQKHARKFHSYFLVFNKID